MSRYFNGSKSHMKPITKKALDAFYEYTMRDGFLYARLFPGSGYGPFLRDLDSRLKSGDISLDEAYDLVSKFRPNTASQNHHRNKGENR